MREEEEEGDALLVEDIHCPSCKRVYRTPVFLPCSHSVCKGCLLRAVESNRVKDRLAPSAKSASLCDVRCPLCKLGVELPGADHAHALDYLPVNLALQELVDRYTGQALLAQYSNTQEQLRGERLAGLGRMNCPSSSPSHELLVTLEDTSDDGKVAGQRAVESQLSPVTPTAVGKRFCPHRGHTSSEKLLEAGEETTGETSEGRNRRLWSDGRHIVSGGGEEDWGLDITDQRLEENLERSLYGLSFKLFPSPAAHCLRLGASRLTVTYVGGPSTGKGFGHRGDRWASAGEEGGSDGGGHRADGRPRGWSSHSPVVLGDVSIDEGLYYWEVDVCNSKSYKIGLCVAGTGARVTHIPAWSLARNGAAYSVCYDGESERLDNVPPGVKKIGVCLNYTGGSLTFSNVLSQEHIYTIPTIFRQPVCPAFELGQGRLAVCCGLPPPEYQFTMKLSGYKSRSEERGPGWSRDVHFPSVLPFLQQFEDLVVDRTDCGVASAFGSTPTIRSCCSGSGGSARGSLEYDGGDGEGEGV